jgi:hypothetical protein
MYVRRHTSCKEADQLTRLQICCLMARERHSMYALTWPPQARSDDHSTMLMNLCTGRAVPRINIAVRMGNTRNWTLHRTISGGSCMVSGIHTRTPQTPDQRLTLESTIGASLSPAHPSSEAASKPLESEPRTSSPSSSAKSSPSTVSSCPLSSHRSCSK